MGINPHPAWRELLCSRLHTQSPTVSLPGTTLAPGLLDRAAARPSGQRNGRTLWPGLTAVCLLGLAHAGPTGLLNDTGQSLCFDGSTSMVSCETTNGGDASSLPRQDGRFGRDAAAAAGLLGKTGGGKGGFDFTRICMDGTPDCSAAADTGASPAGYAWACTRDNVTQLVWSLYSGGTGMQTPYGNIDLPNTENAQQRCGFSSGWRLPTRRELLSIVLWDGSSPAIDLTYFPDTKEKWYWTSDLVAQYLVYPDIARIVSFQNGSTSSAFRTSSDSYYVRLVRSAP